MHVIIIIIFIRVYTCISSLTIVHPLLLSIKYYKQKKKKKREKTFTVLELPAKVFSTKFGRVISTYGKFQHSAKVFSAKWSLLTNL